MLVKRNQIAFENQLERDGILHINDISKMDHGREQNLALTSHRGAIQRENQELQNAFTAAESALDRARNKIMQLKRSNLPQTYAGRNADLYLRSS